ncbi:hypothetical protein YASMINEVIRUS_1452 [Yasminevirus sp. GU-2018]|uniref:Uncharacterized protein n=1 Tax=Yasminevirus sp. GU-2018 TaxID=2420051 RepID=A0A5K0UB56_9VIRU|nr:hypothetical protein YASMINEVIRUS_1452 [Yasminevirus sp. GU-2018]
MFLKTKLTPFEQFTQDVKSFANSTSKLVNHYKVALKISGALFAMCVLSFFEYLTHADLSDKTLDFLDYYRIPDAVTLRSMIVYSACIGYCVFKYVSLTVIYVTEQTRLLRNAYRMSERNFFVASSLMFGSYAYNVLYTAINCLIIPLWLYVLTSDDAKNNYGYGYGSYTRYNRYNPSSSMSYHKITFVAIVISVLFGVLQLIEYARLVLSAFRDMKIVIHRHEPIRVVSGYHVQKKVKVDDETSRFTSKIETSFNVFGDESYNSRYNLNNTRLSGESFEQEPNDYEVVLCKIDHNMYYNVFFENAKKGAKRVDTDFEGQMFITRRRYIYKSAIFDVHRLLTGVCVLTLSLLMFERVIGTTFDELADVVLTVMFFAILLHIVHIICEGCVWFYTKCFLKRAIDYSEDANTTSFMNFFDRDSVHFLIGMCVYGTFREGIEVFEQNSYHELGFWIASIGFYILTTVAKVLPTD